MHSVTCFIVKQRIGRELAAAPASGPLLGFDHKSPGDALLPFSRNDEDAFEERDGRRLCSVHVVRAQRNLDKAMWFTGGRQRNELSEAARASNKTMTSRREAPRPGGVATAADEGRASLLGVGRYTR